MDVNDPLRALIAAHPEFSPEGLTDALHSMDDCLDVGNTPRPYGEGERGAHELVIAYLRHFGTPDWDGTPGEQSDRSRDMLIEKIGGLVDVELPDEETERWAWLRFDVLGNLLADHVLMLNVLLHGSGHTAQDFLLSKMADRLIDDIVWARWLAASAEPRPDDGDD